MGKGFVVALALFTSAIAANAGTEMLEPQIAPQPQTYYAPPPLQPVYYVAPRPVVSVVVAPRYRCYSRPVAIFRPHRFYAHRAFWH